MRITNPNHRTLLQYAEDVPEEVSSGAVSLWDADLDHYKDLKHLIASLGFKEGQIEEENVALDAVMMRLSEEIEKGGNETAFDAKVVKLVAF